MPDEIVVSSMDATTTLDDTDVLYVLKDPAGTPLDRKVTGATVKAAATGLTETGGPTALAMGAVVDGAGLKRSGSSIVGFTLPSGEIVGTTPRVQAVASAATVTPNADTNDVVTVTAQAEAVTFAAPTGTPVQGQKLVIRIKDNGTARAITWNAIYRAIGVTLSTTTVLGKTTYIGAFYNSTDTKWDCVAVAQEA